MTSSNRAACSRDDSGYGEPSQRLQKVWIAGALLFAGLAAGGAMAATLQDSAGRTVTVPDHAKAVLPAGPPAQVLLHALVPDRLAGLVDKFKPEHVIYVDKAVADLPQIPMLARTHKPGDVAMVADLKPDLVVDYGNASPRYAEADAKIEKEVNAPAVLYGGSLTEAAKVVRTLGGAIGAGKRAEAVAATIDDVLDKAKPLSDLPDDARVTVYLGRGADGLTAARSGTSFDEPIRLAGGRNVVEAGNGTFKRMTAEEVASLQPAVVVVSDRDALTGPLRAALPKATRFVLDSGEPYKVLTGPPSLNRLVGVAALAAILHPETFKMVPDDIARVETALFPIPPGLAEPAPLQVLP